MKFNYQIWLKQALAFTVQYRHILVAVLVVATLTAAIVRINQHSSVSMNQMRYDEELLTIKRVNFDQDTIQKVLDLNDLNVDINSIFPNNRNNPFN